MKTIMYIHGYGSDGNAMKGQLLRRMLPECRVVSPTFDYDHDSPWQIQRQIRDVVEREDVRMLVGSSFGGYHSLCATTFFRGVVWAVNPVHDVVATISRVVVNNEEVPVEENSFLSEYKQFDEEVFLRQVALNRSGRWPVDRLLNFALSTDDELLGDHRALLELFPSHSSVVWKDSSGHRFLRFEELREILSASLPSDR